MNDTSMLLAFVILIVGVPAVWIDTRQHRIPNKLVLITLAFGLAYQMWDQGPDGVLLALGGVAVGTLLFLPIHVAGAMGAGDVKFMGALGALLGPAGAAAAALLTLVAGGALAIATLGWQRWFASAVGGVAAVAPGVGTAQRIPYAAAIATGALASVWWLTT